MHAVFYTRRTAAVNLTGVRFTGGITYDFAAGAQLLPGGRITVASKRNAFLMRYPGAASTLAAKEFMNLTNLSNGGERLTLISAAGTVIRDITYDVRFPWPESPGRQAKLGLPPVPSARVSSGSCDYG